MSYPRKEDIEEHKDLLWARMLQFFHGVMPLSQIESEIRKLMTDAFLFINNEKCPFDIEKFKDFIYSVNLTANCEKYESEV